jgi:hypothetical protein
MGSPVGIPVLEEAASVVSEWDRQPIDRALKRARAIASLPAVEGRVRLFDAEQQMATLDLGRGYVGMRAEVYRGGRPIAVLGVVQRFTGSRVVVARLLESEQPPAENDRVVAR